MTKKKIIAHLWGMVLTWGRALGGNQEKDTGWLGGFEPPLTHPIQPNPDKNDAQICLIFGNLRDEHRRHKEGQENNTFNHRVLLHSNPPPIGTLPF